jgi:hypothetical protein
LADAIDDGLFEFFAAEGKEEQADAGAAVGRCVGAEFAFDAGFGVAADDAGGVAGGGLSGDAGPMRRGGGDDDAGRGHGERFGEGVEDGDAVQRHGD